MVESGKYVIVNTGLQKVAKIPKNAVSTQIETVFKGNADSEKWFVEKHSDETYTITNVAYNETFHAGVSRVARGQQVVSSSSPTAWRITPMSTESYRISAGNVAWQSEDKAITLQLFDKDDDNQIWKFQSA